MVIERFRLWYEHERHANGQTLAMLESVPKDRRTDPRYQVAVDYAAHLCACRDNWLNRMIGVSSQKEWFPKGVELGSLRAMFDGVEARWIEYLRGLSDDELAGDFDFEGGNGKRYRWNIEGQIVQLIGHAFYHRGMIAMIADDLGGEKLDTDYLFWMYERDPRWGEIE